MLKKILLIALIGVLVPNLGVNSAHAASTEEKQTQLFERVKASIAKLGTGPGAHAEVKLKDNTKVKGYISEAGESSFVIVEAKTGIAATIPYPRVKTIKGSNLSTGAKIALGVGFVGAFLGVLMLLAATGIANN